MTIPGAVDAWCTFNREYGTRPLAELLEPAAKAAEDGYVVTPRIAADWQRNCGEAARPGDRGAAAARRPGRRRPATR